jgi:molybdopterin synthase catalytic subunit
MVEQWLKEIKKECPPEELGMILVHNGIVRATSKQGKPVGSMKLSYDRIKLGEALRRFKNADGIVDIRAWINEGNLKVGDDIMLVAVAGRFRKDIVPVFQELITYIKTEVVHEEEH